MGTFGTTTTPQTIISAVEIGAASIDDMSNLRSLHAAAARRLAAGMLSESETEGFAAHIYSDAHSARLGEIIMAGRLVVGRLDGELIGSAGWLPTNDGASSARLEGVYVSPLFARSGLGRLLVERVEAHARRSGFNQFTARVPLGASGFFERLGYDTASHGVWPLTRDLALPVAFLRKTDPRPPPGAHLRVVED